MRALLDVNVLLALCDAMHAFHGAARLWMLQNAADGWASCPLTQNGTVRILSQPNYANPRPLSQVLDQVSAMCLAPAHQFWPDSTSLLDKQLFSHKHIHGHRQLTDLYLLGLAVKQGGRLVTFDGQIPLSAVHGAKPHHLVVV